MKRAAEIMIGEHDFTAFTSMKSKTKSAIRNILEIELHEPDEDEPIALIRMKADGFLHNMCRIIVGTLVEVGLGERSPDSIQKLLTAKNRAESGQRAPAKGLFLEQALY